MSAERVESMASLARRQAQGRLVLEYIPAIQQAERDVVSLLEKLMQMRGTPYDCASLDVARKEYEGE